MTKTLATVCRQKPNNQDGFLLGFPYTDHVTAQQALDAFVTPPKLRELSREADFLNTAVSYRLRLGANGYARGGGEEIAVYRWGSAAGPVALFVHGWGGRAAHFEGFIQPLVQAGWRVVAFDAPGHGRATGTFSSAPAIAAAILAVAAREGPFDTVVAHSLGAVATSIVLRAGVESKHAVLLAACCWVEPLVSQFGRHLGLDEPAAREMSALATGEFRVEESSVEGNAPHLDTVPVLLLHDPADAEMPYANAEAIARSWPQATLLPIMGVGHRRILRSKAVVSLTCDEVIGRR